MGISILFFVIVVFKKASAQVKVVTCERSTRCVVLVADYRCAILPFKLFVRSGTSHSITSMSQGVPGRTSKGTAAY